MSRHDQEWAHAATSLSVKRCPHSGMTLRRDGNAGPDALSCMVCDCFGYNPDDERIGKR